MTHSYQTTTKLSEIETFSFLDHHFARLMLRLSKSDSYELYLAAALVCRMNREGHICLDLSELDNESFLVEHFGENWEICSLQSAEKIVRSLASAPVVGRPGDIKPLILDEKNRLYLYRYWAYQDSLALAIKERLVSNHTFHNGAIVDPLRERLNMYFPQDSNQAIDWQKIAAIIALIRPFCVITGGPGSGKTHTVARILALTLEFLPGGQDLRIALAAPTGKAAVRLQDAVKKAKQDIDCPPEIKLAIPEEATTIHRLLGYKPHSPYFRRNADNPLEIDLVVVDEASMIDLALMSKLMHAMPENARIVLLGDSNQLASVEAGAILGDICYAGNNQGYTKDFIDLIRKIGGDNLDYSPDKGNAPAILNSIATLRRSYRFETRKGIGALSHAVNMGDGDGALEILKNSKFTEVVWHPLGEEDPMAMILQLVADQAPTGDPLEVFERFGRSQILCALREGPQGTKSVNSTVEKLVKKKYHIRQSGSWYHGQPVLITRNDYTLGLFNGDLGVILSDSEEEGRLKTYFQGPDNEMRTYRPFRLPEHETAYALTVHKSQGSEFQVVHFIMPNQDSPLLSRELIYTAITRATNRVEIWANEAIFLEAVSRRIRRSSGLRDALWLSDA